MKKSFIALFGAIALGAALPVVAGPQRGEFATIKQPTTTVASMDCKARKAALPLDHGPRAQTTPKSNQQRQERFDARMKACNDTAESIAVVR